MKSLTPIVLLAVLLGLMPAKNAGAVPPIIVYDTLSRTDGVAFIGDLVIDDLRLSGGGLLRAVTVALTADGGGDAVTTDVFVSIALDGGDGVPDLDGTGDDAFIAQAAAFGVSIPVGGVAIVELDVSDQLALAPPDALLFGGVQLSHPDAGHLFYAPPVVGSTDDFVFSFAAGGPVPAPGVTDPGLDASHALGFRIDAVMLPPATIRSGIAGVPITFDDLTEGFQGTTFTTGGVTFSEGRDGFVPPVDGMFAADDGTDVWNDNPAMLDFVGGTLLNLNAFVGGPGGYAFAIMKSMRMTPDRVHSGVRMSVAYVVEILAPPPEDYSGGTITLLAFREGAMVASASASSGNMLGTSSGGSFTFGASELEIAGVEFDDLVLFATAPGPGGSLQMSIDNLLVGAATCTGDIDGDAVVGFTDLLALLAGWGDCPPGGMCPADLDGNGNVGFTDLVQLLAGWGPCPG
ncbi:MAG: hypothetical protein HKO59_08375 [Phycisphaerales bacterium]|nr:hypothetical protein [Phycisphaerae bacterium]NNF44956.1 hypothetical protein [Phycisphaerales bacterium]NNM25985.1 hypothetical protein [Phycisphaerales bacterium]